MQIVIDLPEDDYYDALQYVELKVNTDFENLMIRAVQNGTPLKGHGKLKDVDKIEALLDLDKADNEIAKALKNIIDSVPTIIEADKRDKEETQCR